MLVKSLSVLCLVKTPTMRKIFCGGTALFTLTITSIYAQEGNHSAPMNVSTINNASVVLQPVTINAGTQDQDSKTVVAQKTNMGGKLSGNIMDIPASISVITAKEIEQRNAQNVEQVLQYSPGIVTDFYGTDDRYDYFKVRGFDAYMYRDGLTLGRPFGGMREEGYAAERFEMLRGADSTFSGVSDPGGSVNFVTKRPKNKRFGEVYLTGGSFQNKELGIDFGNNLTSDETLSYRLTGKLKDAKKEYRYSRDDEKFFMGGLTWRPTLDTNLTVVYDHLYTNGSPGNGGHPMRTDLHRKSFFGEPDYNYRTVKRNTLSFMFDHNFANGLSFATNARAAKANTDFGYAYIANTPSDGSTKAERSFFANDSTIDDFIIDSHFKHEANFSDIASTLVFGGEYNKNTSLIKNYWGAAPSIDWQSPFYTGAPSQVPLFADMKNKHNTKALYFQQNFDIADKVIVSAGVRNDWMKIKNKMGQKRQDVDLSELTSRFGLGYRWAPQFMLYSSYAESAVPSEVERQAERGKQVEAGLKYSPDAFPAVLTASFYDLTKKNITITDPVTFMKSTVGKIRTKGFDLEAKAEINKNFSLIAAYAHLNSKIVADSTPANVGKRMQFVPDNTASLWGNYTLQGQGKRGDMTFGLGAHYTGGYYFNNANKTGNGGKTIFDASFNYEFMDKSTLQVNVSNLLNKKYVASAAFGANFYNPGRAVTVTLKKTW